MTKYLNLYIYFKINRVLLINFNIDAFININHFSKEILVNTLCYYYYDYASIKLHVNFNIKECSKEQ